MDGLDWIRDNEQWSYNITYRRDIYQQCNNDDDDGTQNGIYISSLWIAASMITFLILRFSQSAELSSSKLKTSSTNFPDTYVFAIWICSSRCPLGIVNHIFSSGKDRQICTASKWWLINALIQLHESFRL
jgi:hypothetical protein